MKNFSSNINSLHHNAIFTIMNTRSFKFKIVCTESKPMYFNKRLVNYTTTFSGSYKDNGEQTLIQFYRTHEYIGHVLVIASHSV